MLAASYLYIVFDPYMFLHCDSYPTGRLYIFASSLPYTVFDPYMLRTSDLYPMDSLHVVRTADPYSKERHRVRIVDAKSNVLVGRNSFPSIFCYSWAKINYDSEKNITVRGIVVAVRDIELP